MVGTVKQGSTKSYPIRFPFFFPSSLFPPFLFKHPWAIGREMRTGEVVQGAALAPATLVPSSFALFSRPTIEICFRVLTHSRFHARSIDIIFRSTRLILPAGCRDLVQSARSFWYFLQPFKLEVEETAKHSSLEECSVSHLRYLHGNFSFNDCFHVD